MKIAVLPGDGVGPEVIAEAVKVLDAFRPEGLVFELEQAPVGGAAYDAAGDPIPEATLTLAKRADAILFGDRKSTRLNSSHMSISYAVFCLKKKKKKRNSRR